MGEERVPEILWKINLPSYWKALLWLYLRYRETGSKRISLPKRFKRNKYPFNWNDFYYLDAKGFIVLFKGDIFKWAELLDEGIKQVELLRELLGILGGEKA